MRNLQTTSESLFLYLKNVETLTIKDFCDTERTLVRDTFEETDVYDVNLESYMSYKSNDLRLYIEFNVDYCTIKLSHNDFEHDLSSIIHYYQIVDKFIIEFTINCLLNDEFIKSNFEF